MPPPPEAPPLFNALGRTTNQAAVSRARAARSVPAESGAASPGAARRGVAASAELELAPVASGSAAAAVAAPTSDVWGVNVRAESELS